MDFNNDQFRVGDLIARRYKVRRVIGRGGMGVVYLVVDMQNHEQRALKTILPQYATNEKAVHRFTREVQAVSRLNHPAIVRIYDAHQSGSLLFYTMDYIEGKCLRDWIIERGKLGLGSTVRILALLADVLEYAHQYTIHRDVSPENVMVLGDGSIRLLDFGLAKLADQQAAFTMIGDRLGKEQYKAPEQRINAANVDARADIYSMGVMFFVMLAGRFPKPGDRLTEVVPGVPGACDAFFEEATALLPERRFATARDFRTALLKVYEAGRVKRKESVAVSRQEAPEPEPERGRWPVRRWTGAWKKLAAWVGAIRRLGKPQ